MSTKIRKSLLIADDDPSLRLLVHATFKLEGYLLLEAADGDHTWSVIEEYRPSLVLLDVQMPGKSGLEILSLIRGDPRFKSTRVILLTSKATAKDVNVGLAAGADYYLTKPFSPLELVTIVEKAMQR